MWQSHHEPTFTERIQTKAYALDNVVGTVGGMIGLFMGYSVLQLPEMIRSFCHFYKRNSIRKEIASKH